jgi:hypothetical protein
MVCDEIGVLNQVIYVFRDLHNGILHLQSKRPKMTV